MNNLSLRQKTENASAAQITNTLSLLQNAALQGWIEPNQLTEIMRSLEEAFSETAMQYTRRESSTISKACAEHLYQSILFHCDAFLFQNHNAAQALQYLKTLPIPQILEAGKSYILRELQKARLAYQGACRYRIKVPYYAYNYVMDQAFPQFNREYSARFDACSICTAIDYPLLCQNAYDIQSQGVFFMSEYYTVLCYENRFCVMFDATEITALLTQYETLYSFSSYQDDSDSELFCNISEIVLHHFLARLLNGQAGMHLHLSAADIQSLSQQYAFATVEQVCVKATSLLCECSAFLAHTNTLSYLQTGIPTFAKTFCQHIADANLEHLLVCMAEKKNL